MANLVAWLGILAASAASQLKAQLPPAPSHARLWQAYTARFINSEGRVIDPSRADLTTSEGQSYALFFSLINNDRARFDQVLSWTTKNLAQGDLATHLPAWSWGHASNGSWSILDPNSAADSDLWIAYDLIEAGRLWNDLKYATTGRHLAALIARREITTIPGFGPALLPGPIGFKLPVGSGAPKEWVLNPSYSPVFILDRLASIDPASPWARRRRLGARSAREKLQKRLCHGLGLLHPRRRLHPLHRQRHPGSERHRQL